MKKFAVLLSACILAGSIAAPMASFAENTTVVVGDKLDFSGGAEPIILEDRLMLPLRAVAEALDATIYWFNDEKRIQIVRYDSLLSLQIGNTMMGCYKIENGAPVLKETITMDVAATIHADRTYVPVRAISEAFSADIQWDNPNRTATIIPSEVDENYVSVGDISGMAEKTLCSAYGVICRDSESGIYYLRALQQNSSGEYDKVYFCTPTNTSMSEQTLYSEYISQYWFEQFGTENPSGTVVYFTGITGKPDGASDSIYLVINKTTTGIRSLGQYDAYMKSLGMSYTPFESSVISY